MVPTCPDLEMEEEAGMEMMALVGKTGTEQKQVMVVVMAMVEIKAERGMPSTLVVVAVI